ncbi:MAG: zinc-binding dehydrogenase [Anaerolineae bacterium]|nr:zinc-binding dehydrogenase [Anaerolineae bacterium]
MRQVWVPKAGPPEVLQVRDVPEPQPGPGEVHIAVEAIGVNFADIVGRLGMYADAPRPPFVPGFEVAGRVDALGEGVDAALLGQEVIGLTHFGGYSEQVCVPAGHVLPRPPTMSAEQGAAFLVSALTAYAALVALGGIKRGERVLIQAAAGGVGLMAVDIARLHEATIFGTASASKHDFLRERGVQHPIDYRQRDFVREIERLTEGAGVHIALDSIGGRSWMRSYRTLAPGGRLVVCGVTALTPGLRRSWWGMVKFALGVPWLALNPVRLANDTRGVLGVNLGRLWDQDALLRGWAEQMLAYHAAGHVRVHVDRVFPLADAAAAHRYIQERRSVGKVVLRP